MLKLANQPQPFFPRRRLSLTVALVLFSAYSAAAQSASEVIRQVRFDQRLNAQVPLDLAFRDETGREVHLADYFGRKPVVLALVYFDCPMLCNLVLEGLVRSLRPISFNPGSEFDVLVVSFNSAETPALATSRKQQYLAQYRRPGTEAGWHFLTGDAEPIRRLTDAVGFHYTYNPQTKQFAHAAGLLVLSPDGKIRRYFYGIDPPARDLRLALVEASAGKTGTLVDQVLLFCFHYDPKTGKYSVLISNVLRLAGTATVLAMGAFVLLMFRRDRRLSARGASPAARRERQPGQFSE